MSGTRPNILLIQADQLAANALRCYGNPTVKAPNIDRLAREGVVFENCYCNLPMCAPSRASMHAGRLPFSIGMYDNASEFQAGIPTFAHYLRTLDYRVELSGKMHFVGADQLHGYERRHTTEIYPANFAWTVDWSQGREYRPTNLTMAPIIESGPCVRSLQMDYDDEVAYHGKQALYDFARKADDKPFLLTVSFTSPHSPFVVGQPYWDRYAHEEIESVAVPPLTLEEMDHLSRNLHYCQARHKFTVTDEHRRMARHGYYGMISYIDDKVGELLEVLSTTGLAGDTVVVFCADHGEMMGERGMWFKQHFFEWAARVPLIVHSPTRWAPSRVAPSVSLIDLMPTLLDIAHGERFDAYADPIDGCSLVPALEGRPEALPDLAVCEFAADGSTGPSRMVRRGPWKLMWLEGVDTLLYNLDTDPDEQDNRADDPALGALRSELEALLFDGFDPEALRASIERSQRRRLLVHQATGGEPTYVNKVRYDDGSRYIRNAGAADTKARARLPYVSPAQPDRNDPVV
ncbi:MAG: choline-sulfatase [Pseudomonadota bacterium]